MRVCVCVFVCECVCVFVEVDDWMLSVNAYVHSRVDINFSLSMSAEYTSVCVKRQSGKSSHSEPHNGKDAATSNRWLQLFVVVVVDYRFSKR